MRRKVVTGESEMSIKEAAKKMFENSIGSLLIYKEGEPLGIVTERDIIKAIALGKGLDSKVKEIMTDRLYFVYEEDDISQAAGIMTTKKVRHLVVINRESGRVSGIISIRDVAKALSYMEFEGFSFW